MSVSWSILFEAVFASRYDILNLCGHVCAYFKDVAIVFVCFGVTMSRGVKL